MAAPPLRGFAGACFQRSDGAVVRITPVFLTERRQKLKSKRNSNSAEQWKRAKYSYLRVPRA